MATSIQLNLSDLIRIIDKVRSNRLQDDSLSTTIQINLVEPTDTHTGSDKVEVFQKSGYAECFSTKLF